MKTSIRIKNSTKKILDLLKENYQAKNYNEVIQRIVQIKTPLVWKKFQNKRIRRN